MNAIEEIQKHAEAIRNGNHDKIGPGVPVAMSNALTCGEGIAQGDLNLIVVDKVPAGYELVKAKDADRQLVPGNTVGAKHCLDSLDGVKLYRHPEWNDESLEGPVMVLSKERTVLHPTHGSVTIPAGMTVHCHYQREWSKEQARERRSRD